MGSIRKIIHIDMDAFFAAVEQRDNPQYRNKPLIVGGQPFARGVVAACSYEARKYGIHSAMPSTKAYRLCPQAIFVKPRFDAYLDVSRSIRSIFAEFTDIIEPVSLDEAYLDVSAVNLYQGSATFIANAIKTAILHKTQLTASAGVSYNKFLAKIASDINKPNGLYLITPEQGGVFAEQLPIDKFHGIGKATAQKMRNLGVHTGSDLKNIALEMLQQHFGKAGLHYYDICRGVDHRPVNNHRVCKSIGVEITLQADIVTQHDVVNHLQALLKKAVLKVAEKQLSAYAITVKIKYYDFIQITRSRTLTQAITPVLSAHHLFEDLLKNTDVGRRSVRLLGITLSSFKHSSGLQHAQQIDLFDNL
ncbi:DNA polymerase IV [Crenothrix polyspora]|uniref:DNA polymerase IV n=1 Tax=Crenothrix polyspora TaxID=360316 RepID=A0A1R4HCH7_9GAMM|nr:DNA polymerase IV [Crenothrix polyspora]SJM93948.1 DNA polymerase IV 3 [Crenothrix polyspora]